MNVVLSTMEVSTSFFIPNVTAKVLKDTFGNNNFDPKTDSTLYDIDGTIKFYGCNEYKVEYRVIYEFRGIAYRTCKYSVSRVEEGSKLDDYIQARAEFDEDVDYNDDFVLERYNTYQDKYEDDNYNSIPQRPFETY